MNANKYISPDKPYLRKGPYGLHAPFQCLSPAWSIIGSRLRRIGILALVIAPLWIQAATFTVVNTNNAGNGSLRKAIQDANGTAGADTIVFNIPGAGVRTITLSSDLPTITETVDINGMTQPGSSVNTDSLGTNAVLRVEINGNSTVVSGFDIDAPNCRIRGLILNRFLTNSIVLSAASSGTVIVGNFIGTNSQGNASLGSRNGLFVQSSGNSIGGSNLSQRNLFAGCTNNAAVRLSGASANNNMVRGNLFGLQRDGISQIGTLWNGIRIELGSSDNLIGQPGIGANRIASCSSHGLVITDATSTGNIISGNVIYDNGGLAIDLNEDGVTVNDNGDGDTGPNLRQNYPLLSLAATSGGGVFISGTLNSTSSSTYTVEFFSAPTGDPSGHGEAAVYLGNTTVVTNGSGNASFNVLLGNLPVNIGDVVSATARRNISGNTSELSAFVTVYADNDADGIADELDLDDDNDGIPDDIEDLGFDSRGAVIPCTQPSLDFQNPVLESGTPLSLGAVYRFSNVTTGVDALVTISSVVNAVIQDIDDPGIGYPEAFQPRLEFSGAGAPGVVFMFEFVDAGTSFPTTLINRVGGTVDDVDGITNSESYVFYAISDYAVAQPSSLVAQRLPGSVEIRGNGTSDQPGISPDYAYRAFFQYKNINSFSLRCQQLRSTAGTEVRDLCVRFNECLLGELDNSQLTILEGTDSDSDGIPDHKDVDSDNDGLYDCTESGPVGTHTNGVLDGSISAAGIPSAADIDQDNVINYIPSDHDSDGLLNSADPDSDNDGCYDVMEAGYTDLNGDGELGDDPVVVNGNGQVLSGIDGYGPIQDDNGDGIPDYQQVTALTIVCPANISTVADPGTCSANVAVPLPVVWFNCVAYSYANDYNGTTNASDNYALGDTTVTYLVVDVNGDSAQCAFTITVIDDQPPVITCPSDLTVNVDAGTCGAVVNYAPPIGSDNCPGSATSLTAGLASGDVFPVGPTTVTYEVIDGAGLSASCSFTVTVVDNIPPTVLCPSNVTVNVLPGTCAADVNYITPTILDNCPGGSVALIAGPASGSSFPLGTTVVTHEAVDAAGLTAQCSFSVTVVDNEAPAISCPVNISVNSDAGVCGAVVNYITPIGSDNCGGSSTTLTAGQASGTTFPIVTTTVTYEVIDGAGLSASCSFTVTVIEAEAPVITCPADITVNNDSGVCGAVVNYPVPMGTDNCPGSTTVLTSGPTSGSMFPLGTTTVGYTVTDAQGLDDFCSFSVTVIDATPPAITGCPMDITVNADASCTATANWTEPNTTDNCPGATIARTAGPASGSTFSLGANVITYTATDASGLTSTCSFTVNVVDVSAPVISGCPSNIVVNAGASCTAIANWIEPTVSDNCSGVSLVQTSGLASGSAFSQGMNTITYTATDGSGNQSTCSFTVTVNEITPPSITCPADVTVNNDAGLCGAVVNYITPIGTDNCPGAVTTLDSGLASGSVFPVGTTTVTHLVTDASGLTASCSFTVTVVDDEDPVISCPANISAGVDAGQCDAVVSFVAPVGTDNCAGALTTQTAGIASGGTFPIGTTTNTYLVTDAAGNTASCSFTVTVVDDEDPVVACPANISVGVDAGQCDAVVSFVAPIATDNCPGTIITQTAGIASGGTFPIGTTTNTFLVTDATGNTASCSFTVTVVDDQDPVISCPANISVGVDAGQCDAVVSFVAPIATDNCPGTVITQTAGIASGGTFTVGTTTNTFLVTDAAGNTASCSFTVTVVDDQDPVISCPANITVGVDAGQCGAVVSFVAPVATDNCPGTIITQTAGITSGGTFPLGTTTNTFLVTDVAGNTASCSFTVTVVDDEDPVISCPANISAGVDAGQCDAVVSFVAPVGTDNCAGAVTTQTAGIASGGTFPIGTTTNTYLVTDAAGNTASCSFTVTVVDDEAPVISCPANISVGVDAGQCDAVVSFVAPIATDNCPGTVITQTAGIASGGTFPVGTTTNTFLVTDAAGNTASCSFTVTVVDVEDPVISCPANISVGVDAGQCDAVVSFVAPIATDNCPGTVITQTAGIASGGTFPVGTTTNIFLATDAAGNTASCSFTVTVVDDEAPVISCPANISAGVDAGQCDAVVSFVAPIATDNCPGTVITQTAGIASGGTFPIGTTTNTFLVTDAAGNTASCSFTVTVLDDEDPVIACPANISVGVDAGQCDAIVSFVAPMGLDNCAGAITTQTAGIASGGTFPLGTTTNTFLVTDAAGNTASCSFTVTVVDDEDPVISCPANISVGVDAGQCDAVVSFVAPIATDNCPGTVITQTAGIASGGTFPVGTTTNTFLATDAAGNTASCSFTVTVLDDEVPVISCPANIVTINDAGLCGAVVNYATPIGLDNCPGAIVALTAGSLSGALFPVGSTTVSYEVTDAAGNQATCSFQVTVIDNEDPVITCPGDINTTTNAGCTATGVALGTPVIADNCSGSTASNNAPASFPLGTTQVTWTVTDASGNQSTCIQFVNVSDNVAPNAICQDVTLYLDGSGNASLSAADIDGGSFDNCNIDQLTAGQTAFTCAHLGANNVTLTVTDDAGNADVCVAVVTVLDTIAPVVTCQNLTLVLNSSGLATLTAGQLNAGTTDNCGSGTLTYSASQTNFTSVGSYPVVLTATDASGNSSSCVATVVIKDFTPPTVICQDITVYLNSAGTVSFLPSDVDGGSFDNDTITDLFASPTSFNCGSTGINSVFLIATDNAGNSGFCIAMVTVLDTISPIAVCQNLTVSLNTNGTVSITALMVGGLSTDNCGTGGLTYAIDQNTFTAVGTYPVTLTVTDASGNTSTCVATITVNDPNAPVAICQDTTLYLDANGQVSISATDLDGGSYDNGTITSITASQTAFDCGDLGTNNVLLVVTDDAANTANCTAVVTVLDTIAPTAVCQNITVSLNTNGTVSITALMVGGLSTDNCGTGGLTYAIDQNTFTAVGTYPVTLTVTDASGNTSTCVATITVNDPNAPVAICQDTTLYLDANGQVSISATDLDGGSYDNGFIANTSASQTAFDCGDLGTNNVLLVVTDDAANTANCTAVVTVLDTIAPTAVCQNITVSLNTNGTVSITALVVGGLSTDNCGTGGLTYAIDQNTFTAVGTYPVTLTVTDASGNTSSCVATITVNDPNPPVAICQDITIYLDAIGQVSISASDLDGGSYDNGFITSISASQTTFDCGNLGTNNVLLIVTDDAANTTNCTAVVTVLDTIAPVVICQDLTVGLNSNGTATITALMVGGLSTDNCGTGGLTYAIDQDTFTAVGTYSVILTVTDASGNVSTCVATITINDPNPPVAICQDTTIYLDASGQASIVATDLDGGSYDNGTITSITASQTAFDCSHVGANNVLVIVTDDASNTAVCTSIVTVLDTIAPIAICQNLSGALDNSGQFIITAQQLNFGSTDNCGSGALNYSASTTVFTSPGIFSVTLTVTDASGNSSTCQSTVTIVDGINPVALCQDTTVYLDANGMVSITPAYVDGGSSDNDTIASMTVSQMDFICANTGQNTVILTVTDASGNSAVCVATVTVLDTIAPAVVCKNITIALDVNGIATISAIQLDNGTTDNCGTGPLTLVASMTSFTATGTYTVTLTATDASGNSSTCISTVTVIDVDPPTAICQDTTIYLDANGNASITAADIDGGSFDNGTIVSIVAGQTVFDCADLGSNQVTLTVTDNQGNIATCIALVTVLDTISPNVVCQNIEIEMDFFGNVYITGIDLDGGTTDNCGTGSLTYIADITDFHEEGVFEVVLTVIDGSGNSSSCTAEVTVTQPKKPLVIPSGFSPNGDGIADTWMIQGLEEFPDNSVVIINRWGNELYRAAPYQNDWYGQVNRGGSMPGDLPAGTYFYTIDLGDGDIRTGYLQLNR